MMTFNRTRCPHCKRKLEPGQRIHPECIAPWAEAQEAKAQRTREKQARMQARVEKAKLRQAREKAKTNGQRKKEAQEALNRWVVHVRDKDLPCISCGRHHQGQYHGGHYRSRGSAPHLALDPRNVHKQCSPCNLHLHGNLIEYRKGLIERHGLEFVEALEADQEPRHYSPQDLEAIKTTYRQKLKTGSKD